MQVILRRIPRLLAIVIQAVAFGLIHYNNYSGHPHVWVEILDAILIGLIFGVIVVKTKSIMLVIGAHLMNNVAEEILFVDNLHRFDRVLYFQNSNNVLGSLIYVEFIQLILLFIIIVFLVFLFWKDIFLQESH